MQNGTVDLSEAIASMQRPGPFSGVSDSTLATDIQSRADALAAAALRKGSKLPTKGISPAKGVGAGFDATPIEAMLHLAKATRLLVSDDIYDWYQNWSWLRYLGAFSSGRGRLRLSDSGLRVKANQRRVLSEDLGIGFGLVVAHRWCRDLGAVGAINTIDVDLVLREGLGLPSGSTASIRHRQPDYLLTYGESHGSGVTIYKSLECKGTVQPNNAPDQLARAITQLASLEIDGVTPQGIAVATISDRSGIRYLAVDPGDDDGSNDELPGKGLERLPDFPTYMQPTDRPAVRRNGILRLSSRRFTESALNFAIGGLADYAGNSAGAGRYLPERTQRRVARSNRDQIYRETAEGVFLGLEHIFPTPTGERLKVFTGVAQEVNAALTAPDIGYVLEAQAEFDYRIQGLAERSAIEEEASAVSGDGAVLILNRE